MNTKLFVGNLSYDVTENEVQKLFSQHGSVSEVHFPLDWSSGRPQGFALVTMSNFEEARAATAALSGSKLGGRLLRINSPLERGAPSRIAALKRRRLERFL